MLSKDTLYRLISETGGTSYVTGVCVFEPTEQELSLPPFPEGVLLFVMSSTDPRGMEAFYGLDLEEDSVGGLYSVEVYNSVVGQRTGSRWYFQRMTAADLYAGTEPPVELAGPEMTDTDVQSVVSEVIRMDGFEEWLAFKASQPGLRLLNV